MNNDNIGIDINLKEKIEGFSQQFDEPKLKKMPISDYRIMWKGVFPESKKITEDIFLPDERLFDFKENQLYENIKDSFEKTKILKQNITEMMRKYQKLIDKSFDVHLNHIQKYLNNRVEVNLLTKFPSTENLRFQRKGTSPTKGMKLEQAKAKKLQKKMNIFNDFHKQMIFTVKKNLKLLNNFLVQFDISRENPIEEFLINSSNDIYDAWIFNNINFDRLNINMLIDNENFPNLMKKYVYQDTKNKFKSIYIKKMKNNERNLDVDINLVKDNSEILENLIFKSIETDDFKNFCGRILNDKYIHLKNLKKLKVFTSNLLNFDSRLNIQLAPIFPLLEKIIFKKCLMNLRLMDDLFYRSTINLKTIVFKNCGLFNENLGKIFYMMIETENLESIDLSHNYFTNFNLEYYQNKAKLEKYQNRDYPLTFKKLTYLNLKHNNLNSIKIFNYLPELKVLDISCNNFTLSREIQCYQQIYDKKCLILANKNQCLLNNSEFTLKYKKYLAEFLKEMDYGLKKIDFSLLTIFDGRNEENINYLETFTMSQHVQTSLKRVNLSSCSLNSSILENFLNNNNYLINLKVLCLKSNNLTDEIFNLFLLKEEFNRLENLEQIDLSENLINKIISFEHIFKIFMGKNHIKCIKLSFNGIENIFNSFLLNLKNPSSNEYYDLLEFKKKIKEFKSISKKYVSIVLSKRYEENFHTFFRENQLDKVFNLE